MGTCIYNQIHIIQSIPEHSEQTGTSLFNLLQQFRRTARPNLDVQLHNIQNREEWDNAVSQLRRNQQEFYPIIHIEMHGNNRGLQLENGEFISWAGFNEQMRSIKDLSQNNLLITMAVCKGACLNNSIIGTLPYKVLIATEDNIIENRIYDSFATLYERILKHVDVKEAVRQMNQTYNNPLTFKVYPEINNK